MLSAGYSFAISDPDFILLLAIALSPQLAQKGMSCATQINACAIATNCISDSMSYAMMVCEGEMLYNYFLNSIIAY
jgi:hypothetical protein